LKGTKKKEKKKKKKNEELVAEFLKSISQR